ncbi:MAG: porin [Gammaproteobacteria bacterium]|nr:porin [Gammaproteobacteria bacterium]MDH5652514.1 porin [Gammaproteobacteria bacterium]
MNKKLIALAIGAAMAAPMAAQAEATAYAHIQFELAQVDTGTSSTMGIVDKERGRIGIKGSEDLGDGMSAFAVAEFDFVGGNDDSEFGDAKDTTGTALTGPNAHTHSVTVRGNALRVREIAAGLKGGFGSIEIGTLKSAYKYTGGVKYDPFVTTTLEARGNYGMSGSTMGHNGFINNALGYKNKFGTVDFWLTFSPDETDTDNDGQGDDGQMTYALSFGGGNFEAFLSGVDRGTSKADYSANKLGGKFDLGGGTAVMGQYEMIDNNGTDVTNMYLSLQMKSGNNTIVVSYGMQDTDDGATNDNDGTYLTVGAIHNYSKKVRLFGGYSSVQGDGTTDNTTMSVGLRVNI